eukprot:gene14581-31042_t
MTVAESHDIALALQHKLEGLADVDHLTRDGLEHKVERELVRGAYAALLTDNITSTTTTNPLDPNSEGLRSRH